MKILINTKVLKDNSITPDQYMWLYSKVNNIDINYVNNADIKGLEMMGFIKILDNKISLRPKLRKIFPINNPSDWIQEYRDLFRGLRSSKSMGDRQVVIHKMNVFISEYPSYSKEDIIDAAQRYINQSKNDGTHVRQADFYIFKNEIIDGVTIKKSDLLSTLEDIENAIEKVSNFRTIISDIRW